MTAEEREDRWVAHRREGWTIESHRSFGPLSTHETFEEACAELARLLDDEDASPR